MRQVNITADISSHNTLSTSEVSKTYFVAENIQSLTKAIVRKTMSKKNNRKYHRVPF